MQSLNCIGVIGSGLMGIGVTQSLAQAGYSVILVDVDEEILQKAKNEIYNGVRFNHFLRQNTQPQDPDKVIANVTLSTRLEELSSADFIIENVTESWFIKQSVYSTIDTICPNHCIFAANTSAIPITQIGSVTKRPDRIVGMHFMNPVPLKDTVEVIRGFHTSEDTLSTSQKLLSSLDKKGIVINDSPGFVTNRVLMITINEAIFLVLERVASVEDIDNIFKRCLGHKMGTLETGDLIGLDTVLHSLEVLYEQFKDPKFRPCMLLRNMVNAGLYGRKSGQGFYSY